MSRGRLLRLALSAGAATGLAYASLAWLGGLWGAVAAVATAFVSAFVLLHVRAGRGTEGALPAEPSARPVDAEFIGRVSHEIRTPLNGILGLTQVLLGTEVHPDERDLLEMIKSSGESLLRIINDLLDYSKIQAGKIRIEPEEFRLHRLVRQSVRTIAPQGHLKGLEIAFWIAPEVPEVVVGDGLRLRQVLGNLLVNAIKFTREGDVLVEVTAREAREREATRDEGEVRVRFAVTDTGIGVARSSRDEILQAFVQGKNAPSEHGGLGLGLAISSELVERMEGRLDFASEEGKGSQFFFEVPLQAVAGRVEGIVPEAIRGARALLIDDSRVQREVMSKNFEALGVDAECVDSRESALSAIERSIEQGRPFSLAFVDSRTPGGDLWSLAEAIRSLHPLPLVVMALAHERFGAERLSAHGIVGHLIKPIAPLHLVRAIEILSSGASMKRPEDVQTQGMDRPLLAGLRILLAEDHPVNRTVVVRALENGGSSVVAVANGRDAIERWSSETFDVLLLDLEMPEVDGVTVARRVREVERERGGHVLIVALTAHAHDEVRERCLEAGMDAFVAKPLVESELAAAIHQASRRRRKKLPSFDPEDALKRAHGDPRLLGELVELFLQEAPESRASLDAALAAGDLTAVERLAHRMKGAFLTLSARSAAATSEELEAAAQRGDRGGCHAALARLDEDLDRLVAELRGLPESVSSSSR